MARITPPSATAVGVPSVGIPRSLMVPPVGSATSVAVNPANRCCYMRAIDQGTITQVSIHVTVSSGNISVAICTSAAGRNNPSTRAATSGAIPCPAAGAALVSLGASVVIDSTSWFALSADNTTATFITSGPSVTNAFSGSSAAAAPQLGFSAYQDSAHPVPSPPAPTQAFAPGFYMVGVA